MIAKLRKRLSLDPFLLPVFGNDPEDEGEEHEEEEEQRPASKTNTRRRKKADEDDDEEDVDDLDAIDDPQQRKIAELSRENAKHRRAKNAERKEKEALKARLAELENAGKSKEEQDKAEAALLRSENAKLQTRLERSTLRTAVLNNDKYKWYNVEDAIRDLNRDDLDIDLDTGEVDGLEAQLKALAKKKPYLLKNQDASGEEQQGGSGYGTRTGLNPRGNGQRQKNRQLTETEALIKKYPALRENAPIS